MVQCYYKSGNPALTKPAPCNITAVAEGKHTSCCASDELCMSNGLCRNATSTPKTNFYWRGGCTDPTFQDPACPNYCDLKNPWEDQLIWQCGDSDFCCNNGGAAPEEQRYDRTNLTCCTMSQFTFSASSPSLVATATYLGEVFSVNGLSSTMSPSSLEGLSTATATTSTSASTSLAAVLSTPTSPSTPTSDANAEAILSPSRSRTSPAAIGAGVGVGVAAAILIVAVSLWWLRRRRKRTQRSDMSQTVPPELSASERRNEAPVEKYRAELMSSTAPQELCGDTTRAKNV